MTISVIAQHSSPRRLAGEKKIPAKAELQLEGIFSPLTFLPWESLLIKKLEIEKLRPLLLYQF